jgi:glycerol-3-phosphate cytidylyltransferase
MTYKNGITFGAFDLMHAGHVAMFRDCKLYCDYLLVGIHVNPSLEKPQKNKPVQSIVERQITVSACKYVDQVIVYETEQDLADILSILDINVRFIGIDHKDTWTSGKEICDKKRIPIIYNNRDHRFSSTELRERIKKL